MWHNRIDICKYLIDKGMDPDVREKYSGKTPLHIADYLGNIECAQTLFENGAEVLFSKRSVDDVGCYPAHYAAMTGSKELIDFFLKIPKLDRFRIKRSQCSLRILSYAGNILDILIRKRNHGLLDYYASIGIPDAVETNPRVFSTLYVGYRNEHQWTPFHHAACLGDIRSLQILLKHFPHPSGDIQNSENIISSNPVKWLFLRDT